MAEEFWPDNFGEWLLAISTLLAFFGMVYKSGRDKQKSDDAVASLASSVAKSFEDQGRRIGRMETDSAASTREIETLKTGHLTQSLSIETNARELGEIRGALDEGREVAARFTERVTEGSTQIRERLARLEALSGIPHKER